MGVFSDKNFQQLFILHLYLLLSDKNCISVGQLYYIYFHYKVSFVQFTRS